MFRLHGTSARLVGVAVAVVLAGTAVPALAQSNANPCAAEPIEPGAAPLEVRAYFNDSSCKNAQGVPVRTYVFTIAKRQRLRFSAMDSQTAIEVIGPRGALQTHDDHRGVRSVDEVVPPGVYAITLLPRNWAFGDSAWAKGTLKVDDAFAGVSGTFCTNCEHRGGVPIQLGAQVRGEFTETSCRSSPDDGELIATHYYHFFLDHPQEVRFELVGHPQLRFWVGAGRKVHQGGSAARNTKTLTQALPAGPVDITVISDWTGSYTLTVKPVR